MPATQPFWRSFCALHKKRGWESDLGVVPVQEKILHKLLLHERKRVQHLIFLRKGAVSARVRGKICRCRQEPA
jgi:hypothetical protein